VVSTSLFHATTRCWTFLGTTSQRLRAPDLKLRHMWARLVGYARLSLSVYCATLKGTVLFIMMTANER